MNWITHIGISLLFAVPAFGYLVEAKKRKTRTDQHFADPFRDRLLRPPGESGRLRIQQLEETFSDRNMLLAIWTLVAGLVFALVARSITPNKMIVTGAILLALTVPMAMFQGRKLLTTMGKLRRERIGFAGERAVGEEINQLMADGYRVFHDVPMVGYNIDHVVVGPAGVFAVETKARRKPRLSSKTPEFRVKYDGNQLVFPRWTEKRCLEQACRQAAGLGEFLFGSTGEPVGVSPILALPGWVVEASAQGGPFVLNPKAIRGVVTACKTILDQAAIRRVAYQLDQRARI